MPHLTQVWILYEFSEDDECDLIHGIFTSEEQANTIKNNNLLIDENQELFVGGPFELNKLYGLPSYTDYND